MQTNLRERQWSQTGRRSGIMLAMPFEEKRLAKWEPPYLVQPKLDGERCRAVIDEYGSVTLFSSEENEILSVPHINKALEALDLRGVELDGELYSHGLPLDGEAGIHACVSRRVELHPNFESIEYFVFDMVCEGPTVSRQTRLLGLPIGQYPIQRVPFSICYTFNECMEKLDWSIDQGFEGIIVRHLNAPYTRKRSIWMMKFKPRRSDNYEIVGTAEEISIHGERKNSLGALICRAQYGEETFHVGSGFSREQRKALWAERETLVGKRVTILYQHLTSARGVPRSGVFKNIVA